MAFTAGQRLTAQLLNDTFTETKSNTQNTSGTTTSVTYTETLTGGTACSLTFVAPLSGKVMVTNQSQMVNSAANTAVISWIIRTGSTIGSGTTFLDASDAGAIINLGTSIDRFGASQVVTGLTPGSTYNIRQQFKCNGGTATFVNKHLTVGPVI